MKFTLIALKALIFLIKMINCKHAPGLYISNILLGEKMKHDIFKT